MSVISLVILPLGLSDSPENSKLQIANRQSVPIFILVAEPRFGRTPLKIAVRLV
jgi:hypothetical protein